MQNEVMNNIFLVLFMAILMAACSKPDVVGTNATILGIDYALCPCCGNWKIDIEGQDQILQFLSLPNGSDIELLEDNFPMDVKVFWNFIADTPCEQHIEITEISVD